MQLARYEAARLALAEATSYDEVKDIRDKHEAMAAYARQAKDVDLIKHATEIKVRAERKCGEMLATIDKNEGGRPSKNQSNDSTGSSPTLAEIGITRDESSRFQRLAAIPAEHFEAAIETAKESAGQVTTAFMLRIAKGDSRVRKRARARPRTNTKAGKRSMKKLSEAQRTDESSMLMTYISLSTKQICKQDSFTQPEIEAIRELIDAIKRKGIVQCEQS